MTRDFSFWWIIARFSRDLVATNAAADCSREHLMDLNENIDWEASYMSEIEGDRYADTGTRRETFSFFF